MASERRLTAFVGAVEHGNSMFLVTVDAKGAILDRRGADLTTELSTHPHHHEGSWAVGRYRDTPWAREISLPDAIELVERVRVAALEGASALVANLTEDIAARIRGIALRACPDLPPTVEACIRDHRAQTFADTVLYRNAMATAARESKWRVHWYDKDKVFEEAESILNRDVQQVLKDMGRVIGPPWQARHKLAAAAAISVSRK
ncbi:MAG: hypothetical protein H6832_17540 [Planctomycetes bacterium]|nr:hypothetical protein [Planctomycetota bacterium]